MSPPGQVLVQVGNGLQLWANGKLPALEHRVVVEGNVDRYSIASFFALNPNKPFVNLVTGQVIAETFGEYARMHVTKTYQKQSGES